jgi:anti-anti-sigma factor
MKFQIERTEKYTIFSVDESKMDTSIAPNVKAELLNIYQSGVVNVIIDMSKINYVDSSGLSALLMAKRMSDQLNGFLVIARLNEHVLKIIKITKLDAVFEILPSIEEAVDAVFMAELEKEIRGNGQDEA